LLATLVVGVPVTLLPSGLDKNLLQAAPVMGAVPTTTATPVSRSLGSEQRLSRRDRRSYPTLSEVRVTYCVSVKSQVASRPAWFWRYVPVTVT
jgi:hypothetical protein